MSSKTIIVIFFSVISLGFLGVYFVVNYTKPAKEEAYVFNTTEIADDTAYQSTSTPENNATDKTEPNINAKAPSSSQSEAKPDLMVEMKKSINTINKTSGVEGDFMILDTKINTL